MSGTLQSINLSLGGVPKLPVASAELTLTGLIGDGQRDRKWHGGPERTVSLLAASIIADLQRAGHPISPGSTGENLTIAGILATELIPGMRLQIGAAELALTIWLPPCAKIGGSFSARKFKNLDHNLHPCQSRIGASVVRGGVLNVGDPVIILPPC